MPREIVPENIEPAELGTICTAKIAYHEEQLQAAETHSNAHAYHHGQCAKWQRTRRMLRDIAEDEAKFEQTKNGN